MVISFALDSLAIGNGLESPTPGTIRKEDFTVKFGGGTSVMM